MVLWQGQGGAEQLIYMHLEEIHSIYPESAQSGWCRWHVGEILSMTCQLSSAWGLPWWIWGSHRIWVPVCLQLSLCGLWKRFLWGKCKPGQKTAVGTLWEGRKGRRDGKKLNVSVAQLLPDDDRWAPVCVYIKTYTSAMLFPGELCVSIKPYWAGEAINVQHIIALHLFLTTPP